MATMICVDPGHGMSNRTKNLCDPGATHTENGVPFQEAEIAPRYGLTLRQELIGRGVGVFMTRDDATDHAPVGLRAKDAKTMGCDMLVSIHLNDVEDDSGNGLEVLYGNPAHKNLALKLRDGLVAVTGIRKRENKHRPELAVLKFVGPAVLIELGFIGNDHDRNQLLNPAIRARVCKTIADVILA